MIQSGTSALFDDINTTDKAETMNKIFFRAFTRTLRQLNRQFGPVMENWKWGEIHRDSFKIPYNDGFFWDLIFFKPEEMIFAGGNNTVFMAGIDANRLLKPTAATFISGIFCPETHLSFLKTGFSQTLDPKSGYYNRHAANEFISRDMPDEKIVMRILPVPVSAGKTASK
jgi:acyl-homoserine lactone acylase PvdQ